MLKNVKSIHGYEREGRMNPLPLLSQESMTTIRGATSEAVFITILPFLFCVLENKLYIKMSQHVAETVDLESVFLIIGVKTYFS